MVFPFHFSNRLNVHTFVPGEAEYSVLLVGQKRAWQEGRARVCVHVEGRKPILPGPAQNTPTDKTIQVADTKLCLADWMHRKHKTNPSVHSKS